MNKQICIIGLSLLISFGAYAQSQNVGIGTSTPNPNAILDISSTDKGILPPRLTTKDRDALSTPGTLNAALNGLLIYNVDTKKFNFWDNDNWVEINISSNRSGIKWFARNQEPPPPIPAAVDGDYYLSNVTGNYYKLVNGAWDPIGNLKGQQGSGFKQEVQYTQFDVPANNSVPPFTYREFTIPAIRLGDAVSVSTAMPLPDGVFIASIGVPRDGTVRIKFMNKLNRAVTVQPITFQFGVIR